MPSLSPEVAPRVRFVRRAAAISLTCLLSASSIVAPATATTVRPFTATSPINTAIRSTPTIDAKSTAMIAYAARTRQVHANLYAYGIPVYTASSTTPRYSVSCRMDGAWGTCPFSGRTMAIPTGATPSTGTDRAMVVIDPLTKTAGEYWQASRTSTGWVASWGAVNPLSGSGWGGGSTGAGVSRLAGVVRVSEIAAGRIDHALVIQTDNVCRTTFRAPALKTDGTSTRADCIPEGARIQLDPRIDVAKIAGISAGERTVARAMQVYGGYVIDRGGAPMSVSFERATDATATSPGRTYAAAGLTWDYHGMPHVPWQKLRVLRSWNG